MIIQTDLLTKSLTSYERHHAHHFHRHGCGPPGESPENFIAVQRRESRHYSRRYNIPCYIYSLLDLCCDVDASRRNWLQKLRPAVLLQWLSEWKKVYTARFMGLRKMFVSPLLATSWKTRMICITGFCWPKYHLTEWAEFILAYNAINLSLRNSFNHITTSADELIRW